MMAKPQRLVVLVVVQSVLLALGAGLAVWLGRDEFRLWREDASDVAGKAKEREEDDGPPRVRLSQTAQRNVGLEVARPHEGKRVTRSAPIELLVVDPQPLAEARGRLRSAAQELEATRAQAEASAREQRRVQALYDDDRSASQRALEAARAQAAADAARLGSLQAALDGQRAALRATWGSVVAGWLDAPHAAQLDRLLAARAALLRALAMPGKPVPKGTLRLDGGGDANPLVAAAPGQRLYVVESADLVPGQRLTARVFDRASRRRGAWVPDSAVVWHAGQPWIYLRTDDDDDDTKPGDAGTPAGAASAPVAARPQANGASSPAANGKPARDAFQRRALVDAERDDERWFVPELDDDDTVVMRGAQVLLSEELKSQLRNENDD
ncbi:MAG TPA: hypothetical protein VLW55_23010 [Burkholderiaceae bacterium]|nr:hypothetical protein [Burkholderiaceae bacterium]